MTTTGILLLTLNGEKEIERLLKPLEGQKIVAIDSSSDDNTAEILKKRGVEVHVIPRSEFNHGLTREKGRKLLGTDIVVMLTQDAFFNAPEDLERLVEPLVNKQASVSYARQLPRSNAGLCESFSRGFNYPEISHIRGLKDIPEWGIYTFFVSNSAAAWSQAALDEIGGFKEIAFGEDTLACCELIHRGHKVAYQAESLVEHSHDFSLKEEFQRNFQVGQSRKQIEPLLKVAGKDENRGRAFAKALLKQACKTPWKIPYAAMHLGAKWLGYKLGRASSSI